MKSLRQINLILIIGITIVLSTATAQPPGGPPQSGSQQTVITKAAADLTDPSAPTILIEGEGFGTAPAVFLGQDMGTLLELTVASSTELSIIAELPPEIVPATYLVRRRFLRHPRRLRRSEGPVPPARGGDLSRGARVVRRRRLSPLLLWASPRRADLPGPWTARPPTPASCGSETATATVSATETTTVPVSSTQCGPWTTVCRRTSTAMAAETPATTALWTRDASAPPSRP